MRLPRSWLVAVADRSDLRALIRRNMALSAGINALFSLGFFRAVFGLSGRPLTWGVPDRLSLDFLPQAGMVALMSALVPPLVERRALAAASGRPVRPVRAIAGAALGCALAGLAVGAGLAGLSSLAAGSIAGGAALALKLAFGATLGAITTAFALHQR